MKYMKYNKKIKLLTKKEQQLQLDSQSKMCNWLYNQLFQLVEQDYVNGNAHKFLFGRNLRNQVPAFKQQHPFLYKVHSSPLKNVALRLKDAYDRWFNPALDNEKPHFRSWKKKWFSLFYDEPNKGFKMLDSTTLQVSFGKLSDEEYQEQQKKDKLAKKQITVTVELIEPLVLEETEVLKTLRITKDLDSYYAIFTIENKKEVELVKEQTYISFDPNHKNLAVGIDNEGRTYELQRVTSILQYWDERIDQVKSKRDKCQKQSRLVITPHTEYWKPSPRWERLNRVVEKAYLKRREQIKLILYRYAHYFSRKYDTIIIGDYTPTVDVAEHDHMHRAMLNQTPIGQFRTILKWVQEKNGKHFMKVDERNSTKECCYCGTEEEKNPEIRVFTCKNCNYTFYRDINSSVNHARKAKKILPRTGYIGVEHPMYMVWWDWKRGKLSRGRFPAPAKGNKSLG